MWSIIYAGVIPFVIILAWSVILRPGVQKTQVTVLGLLVALMLTSFLTDIIKNAVGRPRPDLLSRCMPARGTPDNALVAWTFCTQPNPHILQEGWRSFPSGHSSFAFGGLGYLSLSVLAFYAAEQKSANYHHSFFSGQMHVFRPRTDLARCLLAFLPLLGALMIAISRLDDYRHDMYDVTCGALLGLMVAWFSYRRYYPPLRSVRCDIPYEKAEVASSNGFVRLEDEEQGLSQQFAEEGYPLEEAEGPRES